MRTKLLLAVVFFSCICSAQSVYASCKQVYVIIGSTKLYVFRFLEHVEKNLLVACVVQRVANSDENTFWFERLVTPPPKSSILVADVYHIALLEHFEAGYFNISLNHANLLTIKNVFTKQFFDWFAGEMNKRESIQQADVLKKLLVSVSDDAIKQALTDLEIK